MSTTIADSLLIEGIALAFERALTPQVAERIAAKIAELRSELMTPAEAAELLRCTAATLLKKHVDWGITKSVALGADNPRFYRSEIMERMRAKEIAGRAQPASAKVTTFPTQQPNPTNTHESDRDHRARRAHV